MVQAVLALAVLVPATESLAILARLKRTLILLKTWRHGRREPPRADRLPLPVACRSAPTACNRILRAAMGAMPSRVHQQVPPDMAVLCRTARPALRPLPELQELVKTTALPT